ncbi:MAG: hypothetical protein IT292_02145 [Deltaproteobacteria bacterium]|nr:hypothetical protein [Deltaproteobacteria bacterium]
MKIFIFAVLLSFPFVLSVLADDNFNDSVEQLKTLYNQGKYIQILEQMARTRSAVEKQHVDKLKSLFPKTIEGFSMVDQVDAQSIMGMYSVEQVLKAGELELLVSLTGGSGEMGVNGIEDSSADVMNNFSQMTSMLKQIPGAENMTIKGRSASILIDEESGMLTMNIKGNLIFHIEQQNGKVTKDQLVKIADSFDWDEIEAYTTGIK